MKFWSPFEELLVDIHGNGGFVNAHAHLDRAYTIDKKTMGLTKNHLFEKWKLVDKIKSTRTVEEYAFGINLGGRILAYFSNPFKETEII